jgi:serine palmitoyltransferase
MKIRINDCFNRPITGVPGRTVRLLDRETPDYCKSFKLTGTTSEVINLSSYNYLGFAQSQGPCADAVEETVKKYGISSATTRCEAGSLELHTKVEQLVARFVGKPDAMIVSMGYSTNSTNIAALVSKGCLVVSDELNHNSLVFGCRISGAMIRVFRHNDIKDLEDVLREAISQGQPRIHRPWKKILVIVEGLYSMEGSIVRLPDLVQLKKKYKVCFTVYFYLFFPFKKKLENVS